MWELLCPLIEQRNPVATTPDPIDKEWAGPVQILELGERDVGTRTNRVP